MSHFFIRPSASWDVGGSSGENTKCCLQFIIFRYVSEERDDLTSINHTTLEDSTRLVWYGHETSVVWAQD